MPSSKMKKVIFNIYLSLQSERFFKVHFLTLCFASTNSTELRKGTLQAIIALANLIPWGWKFLGDETINKDFGTTLHLSFIKKCLHTIWKLKKIRCLMGQINRLIAVDFSKASVTADVLLLLTHTQHLARMIHFSQRVSIYSFH